MVNPSSQINRIRLLIWKTKSNCELIVIFSKLGNIASILKILTSPCAYVAPLTSPKSVSDAVMSLGVSHGVIKYHITQKYSFNMYPGLNHHWVPRHLYFYIGFLHFSCFLFAFSYHIIYINIYLMNGACWELVSYGKINIWADMTGRKCLDRPLKGSFVSLLLYWY